MAEHLAEAIASHPGATVLALSGNLHSRTTRGVPWDPSYVPMGAHLLERFPTLRALDLGTAGGTSWMCVRPSPPPRFGILMKPLPDELARRVGTSGVLVHDVAADSPAARAGLRKGDVVVKRDGEPVDDIERLRKAIAEAAAGATIDLAIWRDGATQKLKCDLGDPPSAPPKATCGEHPMRGEDLGPEPFIELHEGPDANGHHGRWYVGRVRASPPAARPG